MSTTSIDGKSPKPNPHRSDGDGETSLKRLDHQIRSVWFRRQGLYWIIGLLTCFTCATLWFLIEGVVDWWFKIPALGRGLLLVALVSFSLTRAWRKSWKDLRRFNSVRVALEIERHYQSLNSVLISAIQFRESSTIEPTSRGLRSKTCQEAEGLADGLSPTDVVPFTAARRPILWALVLLLSLAILWTLAGPIMVAGLARVFTPWQPVNYPTYTLVQITEGDRVVKQGSGVRLSARVSGVVPKTAKLLLKTGQGQPREIKLDIADGDCDYSVISTSRDFTYQIKAGDFQSAWYRVKVIPPPRIEKVEVKLKYPEYLMRPDEIVESLTLTVPEGTTMGWRLSLDRPVKTAFWGRDGDESIEMKVSDKGRIVELESRIADSRGYGFKWIDETHGFEFDSSRYFLQVASDQVPQVELTSPSANVVAMIGRPLELAVRARDDHGLGSSKILYRVNRRAQESVDLSGRLQNGQGDQVLDWDYRNALADLQIGDSVSFSVEVSDRYPGASGPHQARSEFRRISFLSREDYLKQIEEKKNRLLSQIRGIYRQERSAHRLLRELSPDSPTYAESCQLEAIRQEMVRADAQRVATQIQTLLDDLAVNGVSDAPQGNLLDDIRGTLEKIADTQIAEAARLLRDQVGTRQQDEGGIRNPVPSAWVVNAAARELGSLVLLRDIESAQEVFARETRMFAEVQASLRARASQEGNRLEEILKEQADLANWVVRLIDDLRTHMHYEKRPLAVLRLTRSLKDLQGSEIQERVERVAEKMDSGELDEASLFQAGLIKTFLNAEFSVRLSGNYSTLMETRKTLQLILSEQSRLGDIDLLSEPERASEAIAMQRTLNEQLLSLLVSQVPTPRSRLFDESVPELPPVEETLRNAERGMASALSLLTNESYGEANTEQRRVERVLVDLLELVDRWSIDTGLQTQGFGTLVAATRERLSSVEEFEARIVDLIDKTDIAAAEGEQVDDLASINEALLQDLRQVVAELNTQIEEDANQDLPPLLSRLEEAENALRSSLEKLEVDDADRAIEFQEIAADAFAEAYVMVLAQDERLSLLQDLLMFQRSIGFAEQYMADLVAEQLDLLAVTEGLDPDQLESESPEVTALLPLFQHLQSCMEEVAPLLDLVAARLDVGTPLAFAKTDFEDAVASLKAGDQFDAVDAQDVAAESLGEVQNLVGQVKVQTAYVAEIVEFLHAKTSETSMLRYRQREIRRKLNAADASRVQDLVVAQAKLLTDAERHTEQLLLATGMSELGTFVEEMVVAQKQWADMEVPEAKNAMESAEVMLEENSETLLIVIQMLHGLPSIEVTEQSKPELIQLVEVLALASEHQGILRRTSGADSTELSALGEIQQDLAERCSQWAGEDDGSEELTLAAEHLAQSALALTEGDRVKARPSQRDAARVLRHFIVEQALLLDTAKPPPSASDSDPGADGEGSDSESEFAAGFISDFVSGETPKDERTSWKVLGERERASLNQNFARELPLEYRGLLKNYYERVAK